MRVWRVLELVYTYATMPLLGIGAMIAFVREWSRTPTFGSDEETSEHKIEPRKPKVFYINPPIWERSPRHKIEPSRKE